VVNSRPIITTLIGVLLLVISQLSFAEPTAQIDRSVIAVDDSFMLTIRIDKAGSASSPDLSSLDRDFHVLGNSQSSRHMISNGKSESWTEWQITLMPKRKGQLTIPAISVNGKKTQPLTVSVQPSIPKPTGYLEPIYLESEVDKTSVHVQEQVIFTLRIFQSIQLDDMNISEPSFDNADIEKLSQNSFQRRVQNTPYRVHELRYAIFPQQAGELVIPEIIFNAYEALSSRRSVFSMPAQGKQIRKMTKQHTITVTPPAKSFTGKTWLPAKALTLEQNWSADPSTIRVGDSITRTISLKADGLLASQLPPFEFNDIAGVKIYPDQGNAETSVSDSGTVSKRVDSAAIIPTQEGTITLPEIRFSWWNTTVQQQQEAIIPATKLTVLPALQSAQSNSTPLAIDHGQTAQETTSIGSDIGEPQSTLWPLISACLALGWIITLVMLWRVKTTKQVTVAATSQSPESISEKQRFKLLAKACIDNDIKGMRLALIDWSREYWQNAAIQSLQDIKKICSSTELQDIATDLDQLLFSPQASGNKQIGNKLLEEVKAIRASGKKPTIQKADLPPLYS
jgi:hypothetical protein